MLVASLLVSLTLAQRCFTGEFFESQPCGQEIQKISILSGLGSVSALAGSLRIIGNESPCELDLGDCSTSSISELTSGIACTDSDCSIVMEFSETIESIAIGALLQHSVADRGIQISGFYNGRMVYNQVIKTEECESPSSFLYSFASGFDKLIIRGNQVVISEISACNGEVPQIVMYNGDENCSEIEVGECVACQDMFGVHWNKISCDAFGRCASIQYSGENCTGVGMKSPIPRLTCDEIGASFPGAKCLFAHL